MSRMTFAAVAAFSLASAASAQHAGDISLSIEQGAIRTAALEGSVSIPSRVFGATFGDTGVARFTSNPGFEALPGTFAPGSRTGFTPLSGLARFTGAGLEPVTVERLEVKFLTLMSVIGAQPAAGFDLAVQSNGGWHRHLNFRLFAQGGKLPSSGIYVVEMELYSNDGVTLPSEPLWIVFNDGRSVAEHDAAIEWVVDNLAQGGTPCAADLDGNGDVGAADLATLLASWGTAGADLGGDGLTDAADLAALLASWGACP